jgi:hypothetical protein
VVLNEAIKPNLLLRGEIPELQAYLAHFYRAETEFILDFKIGNFLKWNPVHAQPAAAQYNFQLAGVWVLLFTVYITK